MFNKSVILLIFLGASVVLFSCKSHRELNDKQTFKKESINTSFHKIYKKYKGVPYLYGGTTSRGFDCSGFVQRAYMEAYKTSLPRTTKSMMKAGAKVVKNKLKVGDLVFFHPTRKYYHVGIYMGKGLFMHASSSRGVMMSKLSLSYWKKSYVTARRVL